MSRSPTGSFRVAVLGLTLLYACVPVGFGLMADSGWEIEAVLISCAVLVALAAIALAVGRPYGAVVMALPALLVVAWIVFVATVGLDD
jgi:hypothetical protein